MISGEDIWNAFSASKNFKVRRNALFLISRLSKWESISYLVLAVASDDDATRKLAETYLNRWYIKSNSSFTTPTTEQVERLNSALEKAGKRMEDSRVGKIAQELRAFKGS
jgi:hypothetical protein